MKLDTLLDNTFRWAQTGGNSSDVILGSMGRIARNLNDYTFPGWSSDEDRKKAMDFLRPHVLNINGYKTCFHTEMSKLSWQQRRILLERKLLSPCMAARQDGCEVFIPRKQDSVIMTNEEEHVVIHSFAPNLNLTQCYQRVRTLANKMEAELDFAKSPSLGYLSSLPFECGDTIQLFVMVHLPAMASTNVIPQLRNALRKLDLDLTSIYADEKEETGNIFILRTNPAKYGETEKALKRLENITRNIAKRELKLRVHLNKTRRTALRDIIGRALGLLQYSYRLTFQELADSLSLLSLGLYLGIIKSAQRELNLEEVNNELFSLHVSLAPAHLRHEAQLDVEDSNVQVQELRAHHARTVINRLSIKFSP